jgi:chemotaxis receptor (MCP) glutamine deamidase CheD
MEHYGSVSVQMSDPSKKLPGLEGATSPDASGRQAQRGDRQKDTFMSLELTASYIFKKQRRSARLRSKF